MALSSLLYSPARRRLALSCPEVANRLLPRNRKLPGELWKRSVLKAMRVRSKMWSERGDCPSSALQVKPQTWRERLGLPPPATTPTSFTPRKSGPSRGPSVICKVWVEGLTQAYQERLEQVAMLCEDYGLASDVAELLVQSPRCPGIRGV